MSAASTMTNPATFFIFLVINLFSFDYCWKKRPLGEVLMPSFRLS
jgi:hypothetical protein